MTLKIHSLFKINGAWAENVLGPYTFAPGETGASRWWGFDNGRAIVTDAHHAEEERDGRTRTIDYYTIEAELYNDTVAFAKGDNTVTERLADGSVNTLDIPAYVPTPFVHGPRQYVIYPTYPSPYWPEGIHTAVFDNTNMISEGDVTTSAVELWFIEVTHKILRDPTQNNMILIATNSPVHNDILRDE